MTKKKVKSEKKAKGKKSPPTSPLRKAARILTVAILIVLVSLCCVGNWYVHHPADWLTERQSFLTAPLVYFGDRTALLTDAFGWTGHDAVYDSDDPVPNGQVFFAGQPQRVGAPAPADITVLQRGEFAIGWSPSLKRPVWAAYHVPREARFEIGKRPNFVKDRNVTSAPSPAAYTGSRYDRGHMVPNHAIVTRFGPDEQRKTFLMTNIAPQAPALNRGPWREMELRIADLWTARYGEIWVIVGALPSLSASARETIAAGNIDVPERYYMIAVAQADDGVRAIAVLLPQSTDRWAFPTHNIVTIDELEKLSGLEFFPEMPSFLKRPLQADRPTRLWPIRFQDILKLILLRFT